MNIDNGSDDLSRPLKKLRVNVSEMGSRKVCTEMSLIPT